MPPRPPSAERHPTRANFTAGAEISRWGFLMSGPQLCCYFTRTSPNESKIHPTLLFQINQLVPPSLTSVLLLIASNLLLHCCSALCNLELICVSIATDLSPCRPPSRAWIDKFRKQGKRRSAESVTKCRDAQCSTEFSSGQVLCDWSRCSISWQGIRNSTSWAFVRPCMFVMECECWNNKHCHLY